MMSMCRESPVSAHLPATVLGSCLGLRSAGAAAPAPRRRGAARRARMPSGSAGWDSAGPAASGRVGREHRGVRMKGAAGGRTRSRGSG
jgi:hypothetical protein